jgi:hypothetical protein
VSGKHHTLATSAAPVGNEIVLNELPREMPNGDEIAPGAYAIQVTSDFYKANPSDDQYQQDAFFMTFKVDP